MKKAVESKIEWGPKSELRLYITGEEIAAAINAAMPRIAYLFDGSTVAIWNQKGAERFKNEVVARLDGYYPSHAARLQIRDVYVRSASGQGRHEQPKIVKWLDDPLEVVGKNVVVLEDINDGGETLRVLIEKLKESAPAAVKTVVLFDKRREDGKKEVRADLSVVGIEDRYVVGWGLDDGTGRGRELNHLYELVVK